MRDIVVVGASAGGVSALSELVGSLPPEFPASVFIVLHIPPDTPSNLPAILDRVGSLPVEQAADGTKFEASRIYVAPPDHHLLLADGRIRLSRGPRENRHRPAVDTLFRSAALSHNSRVIGVILTGTLDDGTAGLWAVKEQGGIAIVQDPAEAEYPSMPASALQHVSVDHVLRLAKISPMLSRLVNEEGGVMTQPSPEQLRRENEIAKGTSSLETGLIEKGTPSLFTCPECHGVLLRLSSPDGVRFRCHTGHAFTARTLLVELSESIENTLWNTVRAVQEGGILLRHLAGHARGTGHTDIAEQYDAKAAEAESRAERLRELVVDHERTAQDETAGRAAEEEST